MSEKIKLKKTLYIGIGGTGVQCLLKIKKCFIDIYGEVPPMIGFLAIDSDTSARNKMETGLRGDFIKLDNRELLVCTVKDALPTYKNNPNKYDWLPVKNVNNLINIAGDGAGQIRSNGRFIAYYNNEKIKNHLIAAINNISELLPHNSPYSVDINHDGEEYATTINVFASIAGGTGSGMLIDILCILKEAVNSIAQRTNIYPWIVLPEIFRAMHNGPAMENVRFNSYGALRTLDYIQHHDAQDALIDFGYAKIGEPLFDYAFLINNLNQAGISFNNLNDLLDIVAKSAFLPANKMGDEISSPFDNIRHQQAGGTYNIENKQAWVASTGSAELIYDSQALGNAYADKILSLLCNSMLQPQSNGTYLANKFFDREDILIRENLGRDDVIDYLLNPSPDYSISIDENTREYDILTYIERNTANEVDKYIADTFRAKLDNTNLKFEEFIAEILDNTISGCVGTAIDFIKSVKNLIKLCRDEMIEEEALFRQVNQIPIDWTTELNLIKNKGILSIFGGKINEDSLQTFLQKLSERISSIREEKRRTWAIRFYNSFEDIVNKAEINVNNLSSYLTSIHDLYSDKLQSLQNSAESKSPVQIFLHKEDIYEVSGLMLSNSIKAEFHEHFKNNGGLKEWLNYSKSNVDKVLWNFVKNTDPVLKAINTSIDEVLKNMDELKVYGYLDRLKILSSPLWTYNTQGFNSQAQNLDKFIVVGVYDRNTSILATDSRYKDYFYTEGHKPAFASTNQYDRIYVLTVEDLLPVYAVNNFNTYKRDYDLKENRPNYMSAYIDEKLKNRMESENFSLLPRKEQDNILELWVVGFILGYINYDETTDKYWMRSRKRGKAIHDYRFDLSKQRDVAFNLFKSEGLYKEIEEKINLEISRKGHEGLDNKIKEIKENGSYYNEYSQISPLEKANIENPNFKSVYNLMEREINLMSE